MMNKDDNTERTILGLLRLVGWQSDRNRELTDQEADMILDVAATQPVSDDDRARLRELVLNRKFGSTPVREVSESGAATSEQDEETRISLVTLLKNRTGERKPKVLADELGISLQFLVLISEHSTLLTPGARSEIASRVRRARGIDTAVTMRALQGGPTAVQKAASRNAENDVSRLTYEDLVQQSGLDEKAKKFWLSLK
jgi:hypothetical protein